MLDRILKLKEVTARTGLSSATLYTQIEKGTFPKPVRLAKRAVGWKESTISEWINSLSPSDMTRK